MNTEILSEPLRVAGTVLMILGLALILYGSRHWIGRGQTFARGLIGVGMVLLATTLVGALTGCASDPAPPPPNTAGGPGWTSQPTYEPAQHRPRPVRTPRPTPTTGEVIVEEMERQQDRAIRTGVSSLSSQINRMIRDAVSGR